MSDICNICELSECVLLLELVSNAVMCAYIGMCRDLLLRNERGEGLLIQTTLASIHTQMVAGILQMDKLIVELKTFQQKLPPLVEPTSHDTFLPLAPLGMTKHAYPSICMCMYLSLYIPSYIHV